MHCCCHHCCCSRCYYSSRCPLLLLLLLQPLLLLLLLLSLLLCNSCVCGYAAVLQCLLLVQSWRFCGVCDHVTGGVCAADAAVVLSAACL